MRGLSNNIGKYFKTLIKRKTYGILVLIVILSILLRLLFFVGIGFNDDSYYLEFASKIFYGERFVPPSTLTWGVRIGVYYPVIFFWKIFGINELSTSAYFLLTSIGSILVAYLLGKELFNKYVGILSAFLLSVFPLNVIYSTQVGPDIPFQFFSSFSILSFIIFEKRNKLIYALLSGISLGICYLIKSTVILVFPVLVFYLIIEITKGRRIYDIILKKRKIIGYLLLVLGFLIIFLLQLIYFFSISGKWFYAEHARHYSFTHDLNSNSDLFWYIRSMFNLQRRYFVWIHDVPLFGFFYIFALIGTIYILGKKDKNSIFLLLWILWMFLFFEFGLQLICTKIFDYCLYARHPRFLSIFSIPAVVLISRFFYLIRRQTYAVRFFVVFLIITSIYYSYQSHVFLRNGMGYVRETAQLISLLPSKTVYIPNHWAESKLKFFLRYNKTLTKRLKIFSCNLINCSDPFYGNGKFIHDAYIVVYLTPYEVLVRTDYPKFLDQQPSSWVLIKKIKLKNYGIFKRYNTKIFYSP